MMKNQFLPLLSFFLIGNSSANSWIRHRASTFKTNDGLTFHTTAMILPTLNVLDKIQGDFQALRRRVTARHILLPKSTEAALILKQKLRDRVNEKDMYVVDAFSKAAEKYSLDETTKANGGLLGTLLPQGALVNRYCNLPEIDKACFEVPLGDIAGPFESQYGYHLLLVIERTNCPKLDNGFTKIAYNGTETVYLTSDDSSNITGNSETENLFVLGIQQIFYWIVIFVAGGIVAELAGQVAGVLDMP